MITFSEYINESKWSIKEKARLKNTIIAKKRGKQHWIPVGVDVQVKHFVEKEGSIFAKVFWDGAEANLAFDNMNEFKDYFTWQ